MHILPTFIVIWTLILGTLGHECYVCHQQDRNKGKCTETVEPCDFEYDHCLSEIGWGSTPYWEIGAPMQYYISKSCAKKEDCERVIRANIPFCDYIWWKDYRCAECCKGDRCNYYITLGSSSVRASYVSVSVGSILALLLARLML